jgi:short-subunit dehydrogenase
LQVTKRHNYSDAYNNNFSTIFIPINLISKNIINWLICNYLVANFKKVIFTDFWGYLVTCLSLQVKRNLNSEKQLTKEMSKINFEGKNILITGASAGIGKAIAEKLTELNCNVVLLSRRKEILEEFADKHKNSLGKIITIKCDVANFEEVKNAFVIIKSKLGQIDIAILNAGVSRRNDVKDFNSHIAEKIINTNFLGITYCTEFLIKDFMTRENGVIVGVSSLADSRGYPRSGFYSASKAAVTQLFESLRIELKPYNIKVIIVKPGFVRTAITDKNEFKMPFLMDVDKAAEIIINGIQKGKSVIQFPLPTVLGSKILNVLPNRLYDFLLSLQLPKK